MDLGFEGRGGDIGSVTLMNGRKYPPSCEFRDIFEGRNGHCEEWIFQTQNHVRRVARG